LAELLVYDGLLSPTERTDLETELSARWGDLIDQQFEVQSSTTIQSSGTVSSTGIHGVAALELTSTGNIAGDAVTSLTFNLNGTTDPSDIDEMQLYSSSSSTFDVNNATLLATAPAVAGTFSTNVAISTSTQYLWVAAKLLGNSEVGDILDVEITEFVLTGPSAGTYVPTVTAPPEFLTVGDTYFERTLFTSGATYNETVTMVSSPTSMTNYAGNVITLNGGATLTNQTHTYRIPAIIMAANGDLIAACDARRDSSADLNGAQDIDIAVRRSSDNGVTWSDMEIMCDLGEGHPASDPSLVLDQITGEIFCFYNYMDRSQSPNEYRLWVQSSTDHGQTWSIPRDITDDITLPEWKYNFKFMTSGRGYQTRSGRLLHNIVRVGSGVHLFASDDHGQTWFLLNETPVSPADESKVIELADGRLMINSRVNGGYGARHVHLSSDGGQTWTGYKENQLPDPGCNGAIIRYTYEDDGYTTDRLLFSNANSTSGRVNLSLRISYDEGVTWSAGKVMDPGASAYSDLTICQNGSIGILYEPGYSEVRYIGTTLEYLTDGADSLSKSYELPGVYPPQDLTGLREEAPVALIPFPRDLTWLSQNSNASRVVIESPAESSLVLDHAVDELTSSLSNAGSVVNATADGSETCTISLVKGPVANEAGSEEVYSLETTANSVIIRSPSDGGLFYGVQTLQQLITTNQGAPSIVGASITDWPAFGIRGFMHDVGRNFQSIELLKKQVDAFARYKLNYFHWHLTENAAWRIESKLYPQLTDAANHWETREPGQFYTQDEIVDFVNYCAARNITVIPEIDIPGHSEAFRTAMNVTMADQDALDILVDLTNELCDLLPADLVPYIHFGTDEVRILEENPRADLIPTLVATARNRGRQVITWWNGITPVDDAVINQLWASVSPRANNPFIDSRSNYINHLDAFDGPIRAYFQQVCRTPKETDQALGGILCYWPDVNIDDAEKGLSIAPVFPTMVTYSERVWRGATQDYPEYWAKLPPAGDPLLAEFTEFENDLLVHRDKYFTGVLPFPYVRQTQVPWKLIGPFDHGGNLAQSFGPETEILPSYESGGQTFGWIDALGGTIHLDHFFGFDSYSTASEGTYYALTYLVSDVARDVDMWFQFGTPSVSRRRNGGNPPLGKWNAYEANVWVNGSPVAPPTWNNPGPLSGSGDEIPFTNEGYFYREPTTVSLNAGVNQILLRVPQGSASGYGTGKWMFSCMPISWDGSQARELEGITFNTVLPSLPDTSVEKDSASLGTRFEGNEIFDGSSYINGWTEQNTSAVSEVLSGSDLNRTHLGTAEAWIGGTELSKDSGATTWDSGNSGDWTVEVRIKFNDCTNGFAFWFGIDTNRIILEAYADRTQDYGGDNFVSYHNNEDGNYHTFRIAHVSHKSRYHVWRDGERLTPLGGALYDLSGTDSRLILGDYSTNGAFGDSADVDIDYVSYDLNGDYLPTGADADGDGMTDAWEYNYFNDITAASSTSDSDGDGESNLREFIADTNPGDVNSRFRAYAPVATALNTWSITVPDTSPNRNYSLYSTDDLSLPSSWNPVLGQGPVSGNGGDLIFMDTATSPSCFFRVQVELP
jgi:hypothetical protein